MTIRFEEKVSIENAQFVCQWSNSLGKSFQEQWMGPRIPFLLTLQALEGVFSIFDEQEFVGLIQKIRLEDSNLHIGRFFINPQKQEQDLGSQALMSSRQIKELRIFTKKKDLKSFKWLKHLYENIVD
ncbi:GNAT family acetyltransferase [Streptococcus pneumoniae]|nr:GNAT family acetyltransferase [Streptococcus pneumoniae]